MNFKAAMFDFDGTITCKGEAFPSKEMIDALLKLSKKMPIAFCTGRQLESFERRGIGPIIKEIPKEDLEAFLENMCLIAENGSMGYFFNPDLDSFEEFYKTEWPSEFVDKEELKTKLNEAVKEHGEVFYGEHRVGIVMTTKLHSRMHEGKMEDIDEVYKLSGKMYEIVYKVLEKINPDFEKYLHVGNSGIGVIVSPADGDKDSGIKRFAEFLIQKRGFSFDEKYSEILVIGDRAQKGGNDYYFLKGTYGTPFTVGELGENKNLPLPVIDKNGERLLNSEGTFYVINSLI